MNKFTSKLHQGHLILTRIEFANFKDPSTVSNKQEDNDM